MRDFIKKWCKNDCPDESTLRKFYVTPEYELHLKKIRDIIGENPIYLQIDEANLNSRKFFNILVGPLDG